MESSVEGIDHGILCTGDTQWKDSGDGPEHFFKTLNNLKIKKTFRVSKIFIKKKV